ncbi:MAG: 30S ribosomal protein S18 [Phycisphaeraceae bacterium]|nr:30S ribosomal protein S18 [Phycisphaeraceae bacterium]
MTQFQSPPPKLDAKVGADGRIWVDYRAVDDLRRMMTPNGKIYSRRRLALSASEQKAVALAIKRARFMALLPYTNAVV